MDIELALFHLSGVAHHTRLAASGFDSAATRKAVTAGRIERVRQGWFAVRDAPTDVTSAVRVGGALTCISVLKTLDVWCVDDGQLHVRVDPSTSHLGSPTCRSTPLGEPAAAGVRLHRTLSVTASPHPSAIDSLEDALMQMVVCQPRDHAVAAFDSALAQKLTSRQRLRRHAVGLRQRHRDVLALSDGQAQSGLETKARLRLRALGIPYRTQVYISQMGKVDLVVGDRLVVELDGERWHSSEVAFAEDRRRDLLLHEQGYLPLRLTYAQVMFEWDRVESLLRAYVARREHRWSPRHQRAPLVLAARLD